MAHGRVEVLQTFEAVHIVGDGHVPIPIPEEQILTIRTLANKGLNYDLTVGNKVRIMEGPLRCGRGTDQEKK